MDLNKHKEILRSEIDKLRNSIASDREILPYQDGQGYYKMKSEIASKEAKLRDLEKELEDANSDAS